MNEVVFSIIMPVYNAQEFLRNSIESIINQTYNDYELILVNDGSTDDSLSICKYYSNKFSKVTVVDQKNQGVSAARNSGLDIAKGEYILFIDSDDYLYDNDSLDYLYKDISNNYADMYQFQTYTKSNAQGLKLFKQINYKDTFTLVSYGKKKLAKGSVWNYIFKKDIIDKHQLRFTIKLRISEDQAFVYSYMSKCKFIRVSNTSVYVYNLDNANSCTHNYDYSKDIYDHIIATSIIIKNNELYNSFINERIAMMILHTVHITTYLNTPELKIYNNFFKKNIKFNYKYLLNNKFLFVFTAFLDLRLSRFLYRLLIN